MPRKKQEANGKIEDSKPTTLEQIWGFNEGSRFGTTNRKELEESLLDMNSTDIQSFARQRGIIPITDIERLRKNILKEFDLYLSLLNVPENKIQANTKISKEVLKILAEGK